MTSLMLPAPPIEPMLAKIADALPTEAAFLFEPKWGRLPGDRLLHRRAS